MPRNIEELAVPWPLKGPNAGFGLALICLVQPLGSGTVVVPFSAVTMTGTSQESRCSWSMYRARFATVLDILLDPTYTNISRGAFWGAVTARIGTGPWWSMHDDAEVFGTWRYLAAAGTTHTHTQKQKKQTHPRPAARTHATVSYWYLVHHHTMKTRYNEQMELQIHHEGHSSWMFHVAAFHKSCPAADWHCDLVSCFSFWNESEFVVK